MGGGVPVFVNFIYNLGAIVFEVKMDTTFAPRCHPHGSLDYLTIVSYEDL